MESWFSRCGQTSCNPGLAVGVRKGLNIVCMFVAGIGVEKFTAASTLFLLIQFVKNKK